MNPDVAVVDYGIGNLFSVRRALEECGASVLVSDDPAALMVAPALVLPGVGAFADGMRRLIQLGLDRVVRDYARSGRPLLGICLGMQMLASVSEEFGEHAGLNIVPGRVAPIPATSSDGRRHKIPHISWSPLAVPSGHSGWKDSILSDIEPGECAYLVHSFTVVPEDRVHRLADCDYNGRLISAAIRNRNVYGCQFHPEKSGRVGLRILKRFLALGAAQSAKAA
jgi:glutamine amidotransferase